MVAASVVAMSVLFEASALAVVSEAPPPVLSQETNVHNIKEKHKSKSKNFFIRPPQKEFIYVDIVYIIYRLHISVNRYKNL